MQYVGQTCRTLQKRFGEHYRRITKPKISMLFFTSILNTLVILPIILQCNQWRKFHVILILPLQPAGHIVTGNFKRISDSRIRNIVSKGPKYRFSFLH